MKKYFTLEFWDYAGERALKTVIQALLAGGLIGGAFFGLDGAEIASVAGGTAVLSIATSFLTYRGDGTDDANDYGQHGDYE